MFPFHVPEPPNEKNGHVQEPCQKEYDGCVHSNSPYILGAAACMVSY
jgi:hypothetical protein